MATKHTTQAPTLAPIGAGYSDDTGPRIRAFLGNVRPAPNLDDNVADFHHYHRGHDLIERMAATAVRMEDPRVRLGVDDCADIVAFLNYARPVNRRSWWNEPDDAPSHLVGRQIVLEAVEDALRSVRKNLARQS